MIEEERGDQNMGRFVFALGKHERGESRRATSERGGEEGTKKKPSENKHNTRDEKEASGRVLLVQSTKNEEKAKAKEFLFLLVFALTLPLHFHKVTPSARLDGSGRSSSERLDETIQMSQQMGSQRAGHSSMKVEDYKTIYVCVCMRFQSALVLFSFSSTH